MVSFKTVARVVKGEIFSASYVQKYKIEIATQEKDRSELRGISLDSCTKKTGIPSETAADLVVSNS